MQRASESALHLPFPAAIPGTDTYFPEFDESKWRIMEQWEQAADERNEYAFWFLALERLIV